MSIDFRGGNIVVRTEQTVGHTTTVTAYVVTWEVWAGAAVLVLIFLWMVFRRRDLVGIRE